MTAFEMPTAKTQSAAPVKPVDMAAIARAAAILEAGGLVAMPTETVYGLAADADQEAAVTATYRAKGRPLNHPLIVHVASADDIPWWAEITPEAQKLADRYWPGPLTMVLKKKPRCGSWVTGGQDTVALRCPSHPWAHALLAAYGGPKHRGLTAPSANSFGRISPSTAQHVREDLGEKPAGSRPEILRHGVITRAMLEEVLDCPVPDAGADAPRASGRLKSHYAPKTRAELLPAARLPERAAELASEGIVLAVMGPQMLRALLPANAELAAFVEAPDDVLSYGASLYEALHELDHAFEGNDCTRGRILIAAPADTPEWAAVNDRLKRATA